MSEATVNSVLRDAVYGLATGDALGVPFEFQMRGTFQCTGMVGHGSHNQPAGTWSDDTSLTLATCDSIREQGRVDVTDMRHRFEHWLNDAAYTPDRYVFDCGFTTENAIEAGHGMKGERDNGNGSLMRIAPLAFCDATDDDVRAVSSITHAHPTSTECCVEFVHLLRDAAADAEATLAALRERLLEVTASEVRSGGYVVDTFYAAKWCAATTDTYADCVVRAVNLGGDTDTTAAVAGALAGVLYGYEAIPADWLATLRRKDLIDACLF
jgi:ADP-ribosylglycohydrolase